MQEHLQVPSRTLHTPVEVHRLAIKHFKTAFPLKELDNGDYHAMLTLAIDVLVFQYCCALSNLP